MEYNLSMHHQINLLKDDWSENSSHPLHYGQQFMYFG